MIRPAEPADAPLVAVLHASEISEGFLSLLGEAFLTRLYRRVHADRGSFVLVASESTGSVVGFVAVSERTGRLYRAFLVRDGLAAALRAAPRIAAHPRKVLETLRHGITSDDDREGAEILAIAVAQRARGRGLGRLLVAAAIDELRARGVAHAHVVTASRNAAARRTYEACGFESMSTVEVHRGTVQEVLVWHCS
ncbi:MAG: GNAT family N-acetyltransferase [Microthrixaceae bacterium]